MFNKLRTIACITARCIKKISSFLLDQSKCTMQYTVLADFCHLPSVPHGRFHVGDGNFCVDMKCKLNWVIALECEATYILVGHGTLRCAGYGQWNHPLPSCESKFLYIVFVLCGVKNYVTFPQHVCKILTFIYSIMSRTNSNKWSSCI